MDLTRCKVGMFLVVPTFFARHLHVRKYVRDTSGEVWNYLSRRRSCNFSEMTASTPFRDLFHARNLQEGNGDN
jgi:hypothetical protein